MSSAIDLAVAALVLLGAAFVLIGSWGLVRLPSTMERLHGPTKATTLGLGALLVGSVVFFQGKLGVWTAHELLISVFLFITAPISANMIAKVHLHRMRTGALVEPESIAGEPPAPAPDVDWARFQARRDGSSASTAGS